MAAKARDHWDAGNVRRFNLWEKVSVNTLYWISADTLQTGFPVMDASLR